MTDARDELAPGRAVPVLGQAVHQRLGHVADDREAAGHVAVEGGVAGGHLALVARWSAPASRRRWRAPSGSVPRMRACRFSSVMAGAALRLGDEQLLEGLEGALDGDDPVARCRGSRRAPARRSGCPRRSSGRAWPRRPRSPHPARPRRWWPPGRSRCRRSGRSPPWRSRSCGRSRGCRRRARGTPPPPAPGRLGQRRRAAGRACPAAAAPVMGVTGDFVALQPCGGAGRAAAGGRPPPGRGPPPPSPPRRPGRGRRSRPSGAKTMLCPSNTNSSCPPTMLT